MASIAAVATIPLKFHVLRNTNEVAFGTLGSRLQTSGNTASLSIQYTKRDNSKRLLLSDGGGLKWLLKAVDSGLEASIADPEKILLDLKTASVIIESRDDDKIQVRVDLSGSETEQIFDEVLTDLSRTAPPIPGFRRSKGGKYSANVPKSFLLQTVGEDRVTSFVIQQIVSSSLADYVEKENLNVKKKCNTIQTAEELKSTFSPGKDFGFNAILEFETPETETTSSSPSEVQE